MSNRTKIKLLSELNATPPLDYGTQVRGRRFDRERGGHELGLVWALDVLHGRCRTRT